VRCTGASVDQGKDPADTTVGGFAGPKIKYTGGLGAIGAIGTSETTTYPRRQLDLAAGKHLSLTKHMQLQLFGRFKKYRQVHLKVVGILLSISGWVFVFGGFVLLVWSLRLMADPRATLDIDGVPNTDIHEKRKMAAFALVFVGLGILALCLPYIKRRIMALFGVSGGKQ